jgi:hypothetical protein
MFPKENREFAIAIEGKQPSLKCCHGRFTPAGADTAMINPSP